MKSYKTIIIGGGISGVAAANELYESKSDFLLLEKKDVLGGLSTQYKHNDIYFDYSGHYFHFYKSSEAKSFVEKVLNLKTYKRLCKTHIYEKMINYPLQFHLSELDKDKADRVFKEMMAREERESISFDNMKEAFLHNFGQTLYNDFFYPFFMKYYRCSPQEITPGLYKGSIPVPSKDEVVLGYKGTKKLDTGYNATFLYPVNSSRELFDFYHKKFKENIILNSEVIKVDIDTKTLVTKNGEIYKYENIINTAGLKEFAQNIQEGLPICQYAEKLRNVSTFIFNCLLKSKLSDFSWAYLSDKDNIYYRAGYYPGDNVRCYLEASGKDNSPREYDEEKLFQEALKALKKCNMISDKDDILDYNIKFVPISYIIFDKNRESCTRIILEKLEKNNIYSCGRFGRWIYSSMGEDVLDGIKIAKKILTM